MAGRRQSEKVGVGERGLECDGGLGACHGRDGDAILDKDDLQRHLVAALEDEGLERDIRRGRFDESPVF